MIDMTTDIKPNRQKAGAPTGGQFAPNDRPAGDVDLWSTALSAPEPTFTQRERALSEARRRAAVYGLTPAETENIADNLAVCLAQQEAAYESFKRGEPHADDADYAAIWDGQVPGINEQMARAELAKTIEQRELFDQGKLSPSDILPGYRADPYSAVVDHLDEKENLYSIALDCGGRNLSVNQVAVVAAQNAKSAALLRAPF